MFSSVDGTVRATIPVQEPVGIDESADGTKVYVGGFSTYINVIDPDQLQVVQLVFFPFSTSFYYPDYLVTLSNGSVLPDRSIGGHPEWDRGMYGTRQRELSRCVKPNQIIPTLSSWRVAGITRKSLQCSGPSQEARRGHFVRRGFRYVCTEPVGGDKTRCIAAKTSTVALNSNGTQVAAASTDGAGVNFFDDQLNFLGTVAVYDTVSDGLIYSLDDNHVYVFGNLPQTGGNDTSIVGVSINTHTYAASGLFPDLGMNNLDGTKS